MSKEAPVTIRVKGDPAEEPTSARQIHTEAMSGVIYANVLGRSIQQAFGEFDLSPSAMCFVHDLMERLAPKDPLEEMLVVQALLAHARSMHLTTLSAAQADLDGIKTLNEYADRASNTYRRLMLALAEYRKPPKAGDSYTSIGQANIAGQQVVANGGSLPEKDATNEQGLGQDDRRAVGATEATEALPADAGGACVTPGIGESREALGAVHGASDG